jgi:hypothetical protein
MLQYIRAVLRNLWEAALDVLFVVGISLAPLLLGRIVLFAPNGPFHAAEPYWAFLTNGQLSFYSMGMLATLLLLVTDEKLPKALAKFLLAFCVGCLFFLAILVGLDPTLKSNSFEFLGAFTLGIYLAVIVVRIVIEAVRKVGAPEAREAGNEATNKTTDGLRARKTGRQGS